MARAAANVSGLQFAMSIPERNLKRTDNEFLPVYDMYALSADEVLLACGYAGVRALSLHTTQLAAHDPTAIRHVYRAAFEAHTDTLLLFVKSPTDEYSQLVSLRRNASEWLEVQRLKTSLQAYTQYKSGKLGFNRRASISVCDSRVLLFERGGNTLYVFDVNAEHTLHYAGYVTQQTAMYGLVCTRRVNDTLVAFSHERTSVSLHRLASLPLRLEPLSRVDLTDPHPFLLFRGDLLLVVDFNSHTDLTDIVSLRVSGNALTERRVLLDAQAGVHVAFWALAGDRLVLWDGKSKDLLVYAFI